MTFTARTSLKTSIRAYIFFFLFLLGTLGAEDVVSHRKFMVVTPEKCGTHLLTNAIEHLINKKTIHIWTHNAPKKILRDVLLNAEKNHSFVQMHAEPYDQVVSILKKLNYKVLFLIRDPRDQAISMLHWLDKGWRYHALDPYGPYGNLGYNDKLLEIITGKRYGTSGVKHIVGRKIPWMYEDSSFVYTVRFENLVGVEGGGTRELQLMEIRNIAKHLDIDLPDEELQKRSLNIFGKPGEQTFRRGQIGEWRETYKPVHVKAFKKIFGNELIELGYEKDLDWSN